MITSSFIFKLFLAAPVTIGYNPETKLARAGVHEGDDAKKFVNKAPWLAMWL